MHECKIWKFSRELKDFHEFGVYMATCEHFQCENLGGASYEDLTFTSCMGVYIPAHKSFLHENLGGAYYIMLTLCTLLAVS